MWVTIVDTEHFHWVAAGATKKASRDAWSEGFRRHVAADYGDAADDWITITFGDEAPINWYGGRSYEIKTGECLRDGESV